MLRTGGMTLQVQGGEAKSEIWIEDGERERKSTGQTNNGLKCNNSWMELAKPM
jgi:hypothetical protein